MLHEAGHTTSDTLLHSKCHLVDSRVRAHVREEAEDHWLVLSGHLLWLGFNTGAIQPPRELLGAMSVHKAENRKGKNHQQMTAGSHLDRLL